MERLPKKILLRGKYISLLLTFPKKIMETNETHEKVRAYVEKYYKSFYNENLRVEEAMGVFCVYNHPDGSPMVFSKGILEEI